MLEPNSRRMSGALLALFTLLWSSPALALAPQCNSGPAPPPPGAGIRPGSGGPTGPSGLVPGAETPARGRAVVAESDWRRWWELNRDPYLRPDRGLNHAPLTTGGVGGAGASGAVLEARSAAALNEALLARFEDDQESAALRGAALIALAQARGPGALEAGRVAELAEGALASRNPTQVEASLIALGLCDSPGAVMTLVRIANDAEESDRRRALAALGLGLAAQSTGRVDTCRMAMHVLTRELTLEPKGPEDSERAMRAAFMTALGVAPLAVSGAALESARELSAGSSREGQLAWLLSWFADEGRDGAGRERAGRERAGARAQAPRSMALLVEGLGDDWRERVIDVLLATLEPASRESAATRGAAVLALGLLGDADEDAWDARLRARLDRVGTEDHDPLVRGFAYVALAQAAGRPGHGAGESLAAASAVERRLLERLSRGRDLQRPWVALAAGILGHSLARAGVSASEDLDRALASLLRSEKDERRLGAYALALGLRGDIARRAQVEKCFAEKDLEDLTRSELAVAVGLLRGVESRERISNAMDEPGCAGHLFHELAMSLELLGESGMDERLSEQLLHAPAVEQQTAAALLLGWRGEEGSVEVLISALSNARQADEVRIAAAAALGRIAGGQGSHWSAILLRGGNYSAPGAVLGRS